MSLSSLLTKSNVKRLNIAGFIKNIEYRFIKNGILITWQIFKYQRNIPISFIWMIRNIKINKINTKILSFTLFSHKLNFFKSIFLLIKEIMNRVMLCKKLSFNLKIYFSKWKLQQQNIFHLSWKWQIHEKKKEYWGKKKGFVFFSAEVSPYVFCCCCGWLFFWMFGHVRSFFSLNMDYHPILPLLWLKNIGHLYWFQCYNQVFQWYFC